MSYRVQALWRLNLIPPFQETNNCALSRTGWPNNCCHFSSRKAEAQVIQDFEVWSCRVRKVDVVEDEVLCRGHFRMLQPGLVRLWGVKDSVEDGGSTCSSGGGGQWRSDAPDGRGHEHDRHENPGCAKQALVSLVEGGGGVRCNLHDQSLSAVELQTHVHLERIPETKGKRAALPYPLAWGKRKKSRGLEGPGKSYL